MNWHRIPKERSEQPLTGSYKDWKPLLAKEGSFQCVYCAIPDASMGGIRNFHVEHYRPKSRFRMLENTFTNLFYSCPICNTFKGKDWPAEPTSNGECYLDPSINDYREIFTIDTQSGEIQGNFVASRYMIEKMHLNRGQLISERRLHNLLSKASILRNEIEHLIGQIHHEQNSDLLRRYSIILSRMHDLRDQLQTITPYQQQDVQRP